MSIELTPRVLKEARNQAVLMGNRIWNAYGFKQLTSWDDVSRRFKVQIPDLYQKMPFSGGNLSLFKNYWVQSFESRLKFSIEGDINGASVRVDHSEAKWGEITPFPEQLGCAKAIYKAFTEGGLMAALQDAWPGAGKTFIAATVIAQYIDSGILNLPENRWRMHPFLIVCPKNVEVAWRRVLERFGYSDYLRRGVIKLLTDTSFRTTIGKMFVQEIENINTGDSKLVWNPLLVPIVVVIDECHRMVNPKTYRTQCLETLTTIPHGPKMLFMSATPGEKVNDSYLLALATRSELGGIKITKESFRYFASILDSQPDKPNIEGCKRLRKVLAPYIFSIPYVKPKFKAINLFQLVPFNSAEDQAIYKSAHERYIEVCAKCGKNTSFGQWERAVALLNFNKTAEPLRAHWLANRIARNFQEGKFATAMGVRFKETITSVAFLLTDKYKIGREHISLVWGGKKEFKLEDIMSKEELDRVLRIPFDKVLEDKPLLRKLKITMKYLQDQHEHSESAEDQAYRHNKLAELKLIGNQTPNRRQVEIDNFQDGTTRILLFTAASGGIGLSFDRDKESLLPREGLFSLDYSGKFFAQLLGRLVRRASLSDAKQYLCALLGTTEQHHVAPILDNKLKCIANLTNRSLDFCDILSRTDIPEEAPALRNVEIATDDAEKDDTIVSDFVRDENPEDDEDDDALVDVTSVDDLITA